MAEKKKNAYDLDADIPPYTPSPAESEIISEVDEHFDKWSQVRKPHERQWYINGAMFRGQQNAEWSVADNRLVVPPVPSYRRRIVINKIQPKIRARDAKFLKNRAKPEVLPATTELKDKLNARFTTKALDYIWRRARLELAYKQAKSISSIMGHAYWWYHWDPTIIGRVQFQDPQSGQKVIAEGPIGDIVIEVGSPLEVLVADPSISRLQDQPKIMRIKIRPIDEVRARYPEKGKFVAPETTDMEVFRAARQLSVLTSIGVNQSAIVDEGLQGPEGKPNRVLVKEEFCRPSPAYPKGRYRVVANGVLLKNEEELPYEMWDQHNPFPATDFPDLEQAGQYWSTTICEQLVGPQREYNSLRSSIAEHLALMRFPKLIAAVQHQIPKGAWTSAPGEMVPYVAQPGIPPPQAWVPPGINQDVFHVLDMLPKEMDDISHIFPEAEGRVGESTSGFQTNLLQEATDAVHAPDIRLHELAIEEAAFKIRRLMRLYYDIPRLLTVAGRDMRPEVFEFSQDSIDEQADIIVQSGSALPSYKAAKIQSVLELHKAGLMGDMADPETSRKVLSMLEMADVESIYADAREDEEDADIENNDFLENRPVRVPQFFENHDIHYREHTSFMKGSEYTNLPIQLQQAVVAHVILHVKFQNPQSAIILAQQNGMTNLVSDLMGGPPMMGPGATTGGNGPAEEPMGGGMPEAPEISPDVLAPHDDMSAAPAPEGSAQDGNTQFNPDFGMGGQGIP